MVGANVGSGLLAPDVLLAGLQRQHEAAAALAVVGLADQPSRQSADQVLGAGHEADVGAAVGRRQPQLLTFPDRDVSTVVAGGGEQGQADRVDAGDGQRPMAVGGLGQGRGVLDQPEEVRLLENHRRHAIMQLRFEFLRRHYAGLGGVM